MKKCLHLKKTRHPKNRRIKGPLADTVFNRLINTKLARIGAVQQAPSPA